MVDGVPAAIGARGGALGLLDGDELVIVDPAGASGQTLHPGSRMPLTTRAPITDGGAGGKAGLGAAAAGVRLAVPRRRGAGAVRLGCAGGARLRRRAARRGDGLPVRRAGRGHGGGAHRGADRGRPRRAGARARRALRPGAQLARGARSDPRRRAALPAGRDDGGRRRLGLRRGAPGVRLRRGAGLDAARRRRSSRSTWRDPPSEVIPAGTRIDFATSRA